MGEQNSARIITTAIWLTVIAVTVSYSAIILTFIMIRKPHVPFNNMDEFVKDGSYNYSGLAFSLLENAHGISAEDSALREAYRKHRMPRNRWFYNVDDGINMMCNDAKTAFLMFENHLGFSYWPCNLKRMRDPYFISDAGLATGPILPYAVAFNEKSFYN